MRSFVPQSTNHCQIWSIEIKTEKIHCVVLQQISAVRLGPLCHSYVNKKINWSWTNEILLVFIDQITIRYKIPSPVSSSNSACNRLIIIEQIGRFPFQIFEKLPFSNSIWKIQITFHYLACFTFVNIDYRKKLLKSFQ